MCAPDFCRMLAVPWGFMHHLTVSPSSLGSTGSSPCSLDQVFNLSSHLIVLLNHVFRNGPLLKISRNLGIFLSDVD